MPHDTKSSEASPSRSAAARSKYAGSKTSSASRRTTYGAAVSAMPVLRAAETSRLGVRHNRPTIGFETGQYLFV